MNRLEKIKSVDFDELDGSDFGYLISRIERLERLVETAYFEGWEDKSDESIVENGWYESDAQKSLKEK